MFFNVKLLVIVMKKNVERNREEMDVGDGNWIERQKHS